MPRRPTAWGVIPRWLALTERLSRVSGDVHDRAVLRLLREQFPTWGILHDPFAERWVAVRGRDLDPHRRVTYLHADTADQLRTKLKEANQQ